MKMAELTFFSQQEKQWSFKIIFGKVAGFEHYGKSLGKCLNVKSNSQQT